MGTLRPGRHCQPCQGNNYSVKSISKIENQSLCNPHGKRYDTLDPFLRLQHRGLIAQEEEKNQRKKERWEHNTLTRRSYNAS